MQFIFKSHNPLNLTRDFDFGYHRFEPFFGSNSLSDLFDTQIYASNRQFVLNETDDSYALTLELPGFKQSHLNVELDKDVLTVTAKKDKQEFTRSINLFYDVDVEKVNAKLEDGVLTITLGKLAQAKPRKIEVK